MEVDMTEQTGEVLLRLSKKALAFLSIHSADRELVFDLRDAIRQAEKEARNASNAPDDVCQSFDELPPRRV